MQRARVTMGKHPSSSSERKTNEQRKRGMQLLYTTARPPQECWSIRERVNFKIALGRFGRDWPRVAQFVSTKSTDQICVYAEEYFLKRHTQPDHKHTWRTALLVDKNGIPPLACPSNCN